MSDVTELLAAIQHGNSQAGDELFPLVYNELRQLAQAHMSRERSDHTLQATALVNEAYLRLIGDSNPHWDGRAHFFAAAAEAMRRILVDHARSKNAIKRGAGQKREELAEKNDLAAPEFDLDHILDLDDALKALAQESPEKARLVTLRYFAGLSVEDAALAMGISERTAKRYWVTAKAWLFQKLNSPD